MAFWTTSCWRNPSGFTDFENLIFSLLMIVHLSYCVQIKKPLKMQSDCEWQNCSQVVIIMNKPVVYCWHSRVACNKAVQTVLSTIPFGHLTWLTLPITSFSGKMTFGLQSSVPLEDDFSHDYIICGNPAIPFFVRQIQPLCEINYLSNLMTTNVLSTEMSGV